MWQAASQHAEKRSHVSLQNILPAQKRKEKKRKHEREEDKVFLHQQTTRTKSSTEPCSKPQYKTSWVTIVSWHARRCVVHLGHNISANTRADQVYHLALSCFYTSDLYQHLSPLLDSWHQKVELGLRATSCLKLGASMILHPNCQQVPDSYPTPTF